eukprot:NODE_1880_length_1579_cov_211.192995_g1790_i0.p1 GENE.NODE_1880_length_1579_cov_211.192995_g1790_i0~~NODE_1880_length_1579_cov_211.192995_g1790_i0.p1  ORF type:complete len:404 (+),score=110.68 NODE_1880_length_1579_cov_211.192995_g1790_i0:62-1273(+)
MAMASPVCSYNDWDPLEEMVLGGLGTAMFDILKEPCSTWEYAAMDDETKARNKAVLDGFQKDGHYPKEWYPKAVACQDNFLRILKDHQITVKTTPGRDNTIPIQTPTFSAPHGFNDNNPRDVMLVLGDEILEAPMGLRSRYFEYLNVRPIILDYYAQGARWTCAPKPMFKDECWDWEMTKLTWEEKVAASKKYKYFLKDYSEPIWEAADFLRLGEDVFVQPSLVTNMSGIEWMRRHITPQGYRLHTFHFDDPIPVHCDGSLVPVRPGLCIVGDQRPCHEQKVFEENGWTVMSIPEAECDKQKDYVTDFLGSFISTLVGINMYSIDEERVFVEASEKNLMERLRSLGMKPIPLEYRYVYPFMGGIRCNTVDVRRRGERKCYMPKLKEAALAKEEEAKYSNTIGK